MDKSNIIWEPLPGYQRRFLTCPIFELLGEGTRGGGKTDTLLMDFAQHVGVGYGASWRGILFRQTYPQLQDVIAKSEKWFPRIWPAAKYNRSFHFWEWPTGERLFFRQFQRESDYWNYHGHEYPWIGWEELCNWADYGGYKRMQSCCRSSHKDMPRKYRGTTNPYGPGHNWVKFRFRLPGWRGRVIEDAVDDEGRPEPHRVAIHSSIHENSILLESDPEYIQRILASARNEAERKAWMEGSWDIVAGGMFDDVWREKFNVLPHGLVIPTGWHVDRAFDWGSSKPFSVGWYAESNGEDLRLPDGRVLSTVRGDLIRFKEWYGWNKKPNEGCQMLNTDIAAGIVQRELRWNLRGRVKAGPADDMIFNAMNGSSIATEMARQVRVDGKLYNGVQWLRADKGPGSRKNGWERMRAMMRQVRGPFVLGQDGEPLRGEDGTERCLPREKPGLFVTRECEHFLRTVPVLPREAKDMDDVDSDSEDHVGDEVRYRVWKAGNRAGTGRVVGMY